MSATGNGSDTATPVTATPLPVIANVSRVVTRVLDRITGDRSDYPLFVATAVAEALKNHGIRSQVFYGKAAWIEVLENHALQWAGCWGESIYFWAATEHGEIVDLNSFVAYKKRAHADPAKKAIASPPLLWSREIPRFYRYLPEGLAEVELLEPKDQQRLEVVIEEIREKCRPENLTEDEEFPNEPIICGRRLLDDSVGSFKTFDRTLAVTGIPEAPF